MSTVRLREAPCYAELAVSAQAVAGSESEFV